MVARFHTLLLVASLLPCERAFAEDATPGPAGHEEHVTVTATRLPDEADRADELPGSTDVYDREAIASSGALTLADLLAAAAGTIVYDQVGNDIEKTFDVRGFTDGSGTCYYLDGAPLNDTRNNAMALAMVPLRALDRAELTRGSAAAIAGGGAEAGVVHLATRRGEELTGSISASGGSFGTTEFAGDMEHSIGPFDFFLTGSRYETDGFRDNAGGDLRRLAGGFGYDLGGGRELRLTLIDSDSDLGQPGALTGDELAQDPSATPFNAVDFGKESLGLATLRYQGPVGENVSVAANLFVRDRASEILSTGRAAPPPASFGGFFLDSDASARGAAAQITWRYGTGPRRHRISGGAEWLDGETDAVGISTPDTDVGLIDPANTVSDNTSDRRTAALFAQGVWRPAARWSLLASARYDRDRIGYDERVFDPANDAARNYSELSLRAGATWNPEGRFAGWLSYGEGFLPPTVEDLFSFPLFGSNPDLVPEDSRSYEAGFRGRWLDRLNLEVALFRIDTENEIVFDPNSTLGLFGANVNAGETRREGLEASFRGRVTQRVDLFANLTIIESEFLSGPDRGNRVPLVPFDKVNLGANVELPAFLTLRVDWMHVGEQVLDNDRANDQPKLGAYDVVSARLSWAIPVLGRRGHDDGMTLFVEGRNLFDEEHATRGIHAFDFSAGANATFFTPAPGHRWLAGLRWDFP